MARTPEEEREYQARHRRNVAVRGRAKLQKCVHCAEASIDKPAHDWAHVHGTDPDDVMNYIPLCKKCHGRFDPHTPEAVEKIRATSTGRKHTPESRARMSEQRKAAAAARGPMPAEQRAKISVSLRGNANAAGVRDSTRRAPGNPNIGKTRAAQQRAKTHCAQGHELTPGNVYWRGPDKKNRQCKTCARERAAARHLAQKEGAASIPKSRSRRGGARPGTGDPEFGRRTAARQLSKTHCPAGHEYSEENTYIIKRPGGRTARQCKVCTKAKAKATARRKAA